jgi:hypothetical protein
MAGRQTAPGSPEFDLFAGKTSTISKHPDAEIKYSLYSCT